MTTATLRTLPIPVPPARCETTESYLRRLARLNHLPIEYLKTILGLRPSEWVHHMPTDKLSVITGYGPHELAHALPGLRPTPIDFRVFRRSTAPACPRCVRRYQGGIVVRFVPHHAPACTQHHLWFGGPYLLEKLLDNTFVDISATLVVHAAQRHHRRAVHRHGAPETYRAFNTAQRFLEHHLQRNYITGQHARILHILRPGQSRISTDDPAYRAALYPETIALTRLLVSPRWRRTAADPKTRQAFFTEISRRSLDWRENWPSFQPGKTDPLRDWTEDEAIRHQNQPATTTSTRIRLTEPHGS